ncbi:MAG: hypothetical protein MJ252_18925 [archaeon]|nr:hypothetical protein [archaeon]
MGSGQCKDHICNQRKPHCVQTDWMKNLNDSSFIYDLTIPGTHNSLSLYGSFIAITQTWKIEDQLIGGLRYFDCRLRLFHNTLRFQHGICDQKINFDVALKEFKKFLTEHPTEFIIMNFQKEYRDLDCTQTLEELKSFYLRDYLDIIVFYKDDNKITVGELRGKILFIDTNDVKIADKEGFCVQNKWVVNFPSNIVDKKRIIKILFNRSLFFHNKNEIIFLNFLSGVSDYAIISPYKCADYTNKVPFKFTGRLGVVLCDFPGEKLIEHLIKQNYLPKEEKKENKNKIKNGSLVSIKNINTNKYLYFKDIEAYCQKGKFIFSIWKNKEKKKREEENSSAALFKEEEIEKKKEDSEFISSGDDIILKDKEGHIIYFHCFVQKKIFEGKMIEDTLIQNEDVCQLFIKFIKLDGDTQKKYLCSDYSKKLETKVRKNNGKLAMEQIVYYEENINDSGTEWAIELEEE